MQLEGRGNSKRSLLAKRLLGMASTKTNTLLPHYPRQAEHFSEFSLVRFGDAYFTAERLRIDSFQCDSIIQNLEMKHGNLLVTKCCVMNCSSDFVDRDCKVSC